MRCSLLGAGYEQNAGRGVIELMAGSKLIVGDVVVLMQDRNAFEEICVRAIFHVARVSQRRGWVPVG